MKNLPGWPHWKLQRLALAFIIIGGVILVFSATRSVSAWNPQQTTSDPLVRMPGTQPGQTILEAPTRCLNCHANYNTTVEPGFNWKGSMMAQASRDFLFWACMTVAAQDSIWAVGTPNATDICERCHFPKGWLEGRSDPTNASAMTGADYDGVHCDFCHTQFDPFFQTTYAGTREGSDWSSYWDETNLSTTPSNTAALATVNADRTLSTGIKLFNGDNFYTSFLPPVNYFENGVGQFFMSTSTEKRASFADATARHTFLYSRYHKSKYYCQTCHDVSNPVLANLGDDPNLPLTTETEAASSYYHVERTFSEFMLSAYGQIGGAVGIGPFAPAVFNTSQPDNKIASCQDCHMRDLIGAGANKTDAINRPSGSTEHPQSGQPLHDLTGGNVWVSTVLASAVPGSINYDSINSSLLSQGPSVLTLDLTQGEPMNSAALLAGAQRAMQQLQLAATIKDSSYNSSNGSLTFKVQNQTGHKLISGFPEGRRMFLNIRAYDINGQLVYEINPYDQNASTLKGLEYPYSTALTVPAALGPKEVHLDELVYEMQPTSSLTGEEHTFHFALATNRYKDNRIPPVGFQIDQAAARLAQPRAEGADALDLFTAAEYAGGYDEVSVTLPLATNSVEINLYYQTTSREYIEFLRDEINGTGSLTLEGTGAGGDSAYLIQSDPFFSTLKAWGDTIWQLWLHNRTAAGAAPIIMTQHLINGVGACSVEAPQLLTAVPDFSQVSLTWSDKHSSNPAITGYRIYYDQAGKAQLKASVGLLTSYTDLNVTNGQQYCYKVTAVSPGCESPYSNILCAAPQGSEVFLPLIKR